MNVLTRTAVAQHRMRDPTLLLEPAIAPAEKIRNGVLCEELRIRAGEGGFARDGLRAVLAELRGLSIAVRIRPRTARTIETVLLVQFEERAKRSPDSHLAEPVSRRLVNGREPRRRFVTPTSFGAVFLERRLGAAN